MKEAEATRTRPLIGYPTRSGITGTGYTSPRFANNESYARAIVDHGGVPVMIPSVGDDEVIGTVYDLIDGLLLTGGPDVDPARYGAERHPKTDAGDAAMEHAEVYLAQRALQDDMPVFAICRGIQALNVVGGGTLYQDVTDEFDTPIMHPSDAQGRSYLAHAVSIDASSRLARALGTAEIEVNSLHHQAVRELAPGFAITAHAPDGLIEAIEHPERPFVVGVQWHPEELYRTDETWSRLFRAFIMAAAEYRERRTAS